MLGGRNGGRSLRAGTGPAASVSAAASLSGPAVGGRQRRSIEATLRCEAIRCPLSKCLLTKCNAQLYGQSWRVCDSGKREQLAHTNSATGETSTGQGHCQHAFQIPLHLSLCYQAPFLAAFYCLRGHSKQRILLWRRWHMI